MLKAAVIGSGESVNGFGALGLKTYSIDDPQQAARTIAALAEDAYGVIYITEALYAEIQPSLERYQERLTPAIIPIPGVSGNTGIGMRNVSKAVEKAVGSDIIQ